jgi:hypothetical protein
MPKPPGPVTPPGQAAQQGFLAVTYTSGNNNHKFDKGDTLIAGSSDRFTRQHDCVRHVSQPRRLPSGHVWGCRLNSR